MADFIKVDLTMPELVGKTGVTHPNVPPYDDITLLIVAWNEEERIGALLDHLLPWFSHSVICIQESTDRTYEVVTEKVRVAESRLHRVLTDAHWGHGDKSYPRMVREAYTRWCFVVSCDEWPTLDLLQSLETATAAADLDRRTDQAIWVPFRSWIDDLEVEGEHGHLRLFKTLVGWPETLHSRPMTTRALWWPFGCIEHRRSLDEMMRDYLSYFKVGRGHKGWDAHNTAQMHDACQFVANAKGWEYVRNFEWWPQIESIAFREGVPHG